MRILLCTLFCGILADTEGPPPHMLIAQRLMSSLPEVIQDGMTGQNDGLKNMISNVLGDGLISQLVVNPIGVAEEVLPDLGLNKTEVMSNLDAMSGGMASNLRSNGSRSNVKGSLFGRNSSLLSFLTTTPKPTTEQVMLVDGHRVDFDDFIRKHHLEGQFSTKKPPTTPVPPPTSEKIAEEVLNKLRGEVRTNALHRSRPMDDFGSTLNMANIDPSRVNEVNKLLRRAPQKFDTLDVFGSPPGFVQERALDPAIDEVVTNIRTRGPEGMSVEDVRRLKNILRTYEESLQTKEFIAKRKQLQVLQTELQEQRKRIDMQKRMESELRKKEQELESRRLKMEAQLREQLSSWNLTAMPDSPTGIPPINLPEMNLGQYPTLMEKPTSPPMVVEPMQQAVEEEWKTQTTVQLPTPTTAQPRTKSTRSHSPARSSLRFAPVGRPIIPASTQISSEDEEFSSKCECTRISMDRMQGRWVVALASEGLLGRLYEKLTDVLHLSSPSSLQCSSVEVSSPKQSVAAQEARINMEFRTSASNRLNRLRGSALSIDHRTTRVQFKNYRGELFSAPICLLRSGGEKSYEYMLVTSADGPCNEAALLVRDPQTFFDKSNTDLVDYLKEKIAGKELESLDMVYFANACDE